MLKEENNGANLNAIFPMLVSTTVFVFQSSVNGKNNNVFINNKSDDTCTRSAYSKDVSCTDTYYGICIINIVSFDTVGDAVSFYATVYGLTEEELTKATCQSGVLTISIHGL